VVYSYQEAREQNFKNALAMLKPVAPIGSSPRFSTRGKRELKPSGSLFFNSLRSEGNEWESMGDLLGSAPFPPSKATLEDAHRNGFSGPRTVRVALGLGMFALVAIGLAVMAEKAIDRAVAVVISIAFLSELISSVRLRTRCSAFLLVKERGGAEWVFLRGAEGRLLLNRIPNREVWTQTCVVLEG
jgi:hypothetical protein